MSETRLSCVLVSTLWLASKEFIQEIQFPCYCGCLDLKLPVGEEEQGAYILIPSCLQVCMMRCQVQRNEQVVRAFVVQLTILSKKQRRHK